MDKYICIHGHFYQPPRENPWLEEIEFQDSAYPYHDWNERITAECYAPNASSRILDAEGKIMDIVNIYSKISFDFGPTLLSWLERHKPDEYEAILKADQVSMGRFSGYGSAIAQAYNHMILPLANRRDKYTQIIWGIKDFEKRFKRYPEGMWLPEAAVDKETLEVLVSLGIKFTILAPRQAQRIRKKEEPGAWHDVKGEKIDPTRAYLCELPSGRVINLFFYDGPISRDVSFGGLLNNGESFAGKLLSAFHDQRKWAQLVHIATDGETFGHHHRFGDMALAYSLHYIEAKGLARITNYGEYLKKHPPTHTADIFENSSWSCVHGIDRWRSNCGCNSGMHSGWSQEWRKPLREAMDWLRDRLIPVYGSEAAKYFQNPWDTRNDYIEVILDRSRENIEKFFSKHALRPLSKTEKMKALKLLEAQRNAMLMYTSCGWFFDEISGIETVQIMQYASKAIQYMEEITGSSPEGGYLERLQSAPSNIYRNAVEPYEMFVKNAKSDLLRVGAHYCISSVFEEYPEYIKLYCYTAKSEVYDRREAGKLKLATGKAVISSDITWDEKTISFTVLHLGDHNINAGVKDFQGDRDFSLMQAEMTQAFEKGDLPEVIRLMDKHFNGNIFSLWHLFKDEQRQVLDMVLKSTYENVESSYRNIYENNSVIMNFYQNLQHRIPRPFLYAAEYIINTDLKRIFEEENPDAEKLKKIMDETRRWSIKIDTTTIGFVASSWINSVMGKLNSHPEDVKLFEKIDETLELMKPFSLPLNLWNAQNIYFSIGKNIFSRMKEQARGGDAAAQKWVEGFTKLGYYLEVKI
jgi:alpha-amylase/alpha-mannosidase (GH57 family)